MVESSTAVSILISAAGSAVVKLAGIVQKTIRRIGSRSTARIDPEDPDFKEWCSETISGNSRRWKRDANTVNELVKRQAFSIEDFKSLSQDQQIMLAGVLYALKAVDQRISDRIDDLISSQNDKFETINRRIDQVATRTTYDTPRYDSPSSRTNVTTGHSSAPKGMFMPARIAVHLRRPSNAFHLIWWIAAESPAA